MLTAVSIEYRAVRARLANPQLKVHPTSGVPYTVGTYGDWEIALLEIGPRNANAASEAVQAVTFFEPEVLMFVGVAGGLKDVAIGDVVVATSVYGYHSGKSTDKTFEPRPDVAHSDHSLVAHARVLVSTDEWWNFIGEGQTTGPKAIVGPIAAGDEVVSSDDADTAQFLRSQYGDARAVEMEGHGVLTAARITTTVKAIIVRGISDLLSGKSETDKVGSQEHAANNATAMAFAILDQVAKTSKPPSPDRTENKLQTQLLALQAELIDGSCSVSAGLRRALSLLQSNRHLSDEKDLRWIRSELEGFSDEDLVHPKDESEINPEFPKYRIMRGVLMGMHPRRGIEPIGMFDIDGNPLPILERICSPPVTVVVPEIESILSEKQESVTLSLNSDARDYLMKGLFETFKRLYGESVARLNIGQLQPFLEYHPSRFVSLLEAVRGKLIDVIGRALEAAQRDNSTPTG